MNHITGLLPENENLGKHAVCIAQSAQWPVNFSTIEHKVSPLCIFTRTQLPSTFSYTSLPSCREVGSRDKTGNTDHNVSLYLLSPWDPPFPLTPRVSKRIGRESSLFPWVAKKSESLPTPSANTSSRWLGKSYKPWLKKLSPKYKLLKDGATLLSSHVYLHPHLFSIWVWGLDQGRCHQLLSFSSWVRDPGKGWKSRGTSVRPPSLPTSVPISLPSSSESHPAKGMKQPPCNPQKRQMQSRLPGWPLWLPKKCQLMTSQKERRQMDWCA